ncbi:hypothetical protein DITRI_Ditri20bG0050800 [Diplodiscus trichospermus]
MERFALESHKDRIKPIQENLDWRVNLFTIFVDRLSTRVSRKALLEVFNLYGKVVDVFIPLRKRREDSKTTFALVRYKHENEMRRATERANNRKIDGWHVLLEGLEEPYKVLRSNQDLSEGMKKENSEVETVIIYDHMIPDSEVEWLQGCAIRRFRDGMNVKKAQDLIEAEDISCQMCVMGDATILLKFDSKERMEGTLSSFNEMFDTCFEDLRP